jgi:hypothetical protein
VDAVVLAQGSMALLLSELKAVKIPVLASLQSGALRCKEMLGQMG